MNTDNKTTRELAIGWFNSKASLEKTRLCDTNTEIVGTVRRWETLTGREIELIYLSEHPTETETKKEKGKEGDILEGMNIIAKIVDYCFDKIDADLLSSKQEFHRLVSIKAHLKNNEDCRLISLAPQLAKENKELKEQIDKIAAELRRAKTFEELAEDTIKEKEKENKSLREANERMKEAFSELMRFKNVMETGADTLQYPDNFLKAIDEAKQALNQ